MTLRWCWLACLAMVSGRDAVADPAAVDIEAAIAMARAHHPAFDEDAAGVRAAEARVDVERARYWPEVTVFGELDRATSNAVAGALFPISGLPVVGGTTTRNFDAGKFGTAAGATASWDAIGFARWDALIDQARAEVRATRLDATARELALGFDAGDRLIAVVARDEAVKAARSGVDRAQVFVTTVKAAVDQKLRPGADLSRAEAELAIAQTVQVRAETAAQLARAQLATALGLPPGSIAVNPGKLLALPPRPSAAAGSRTDPRIAAAEARIAADEARRRAVETQTLPRINLVGALWGRATGTDETGVGAHGLVPDVPNWALGVVVTWSAFAGASVGAQARAEAAIAARDRARERAIGQAVDGELAQAGAVLDGAFRVAEHTPVALKAARDAEQQANARYQAKLITADEVAQAQRLLEQAEIDDAVARLEVWRAILLGAYAAGDLGRFTDLYRTAGG